MSDLISRADAIDAVCRDCTIERKDKCKADGYCYEVKNLMALPSADAVGVCKSHEEEHLNIINRIKELQYAIAKTQTIVGKMVESADAEQGEWIHDGQNFKGGLDWCHCSVCGQKTSTNGLSVYRYCPNCGSRMKGGAE